MTTQGKGDLLRWALRMYVDHGRKPHRLRPPYHEFADDMATALALSGKRHALAERYCNGVERPDDEAREEKYIEQLETIAQRYGWKYESHDGGLSSCFAVKEHYQESVFWQKIPIP